VQTLDLSTASEKIRKDIQRYVKELQVIARSPIDTVERGIRTLQALREVSYEDLNQIQHEYAAFCAARWLIARGHAPKCAAWQWNPRQTGDAREPDIRAVLCRRTIISGEVTTSRRPVGVLDTRMASTLRKLSTMEGKRFYFVLTTTMANRARTKTTKAGYDVEVVQLDDQQLIGDLSAPSTMERALGS
jgi:hypothetical protein